MSITIAATDGGGIADAGNGADVTHTIDPRYGHEIRHNGLDTSGSAATDNIVIGLNATSSGSYTAGNKKLILRYGDPPIFIKPGPTTLYLWGKGSAPTVTIVQIASMADRG